MKELTLNERQQVSFEILLDFDRICKKYHIKYYLAYGTLLGAVRHKNFIPWDNDLDVMVPAEQIEELLFHLKEESRYRLIDFYKDKNWVWHFSKLVDDRTIDIDNDPDSCESKQTTRGQAIDIYSLIRTNDPNGSSVKKMRRFLGYVYVLFKYNHGYFNNSLSKRVFCFLISLFGRDILFYKKLIHKIETQSSFGDLCLVLSPKLFFYDYSDFSDSIFLDFNGSSFPAPAGYDHVLKEIYGDYMTLPPVNERVTHESYRTCWKE